MRFSLTLFRALLIGLFISGAVCRGGVAAYSDPGKIDFDTAMELLNPYGTWSKVGDLWTFTPLDHAAPYTNGRWLYTEYGWFWKGNAPHSWLTEHYGYWKRGADKVWSWYPGPVWLPQIVEIRGSPAGIGWRSAEVDHDGNFTEQPADRYTKTEEWTFVTPAQFALPITPESIPKGAGEEQMLEQSTDSIHSYLTYRELDRPGPHPADFINMGDGKMFPPMTEAEKAKALRPVAVAKANAQKKSKAKGPVDPARLAASLTASEEVPDIPQQPGAEDPNDDPRQVKYWVTMCLPDAWAKPPADPKRDELYIYRPDFYQDQDGIERRITLWLNPSLRSSEAIHLADILKNQKPATAPVAGYSATAVPAAPARDFSSPFGDGYDDNAGASTRKKAKPQVNMAGAPVSAAPSTNAAPQPASAPASTGPDDASTPSSLAPAPAGRAAQQ